MESFYINDRKDRVAVIQPAEHTQFRNMRHNLAWAVNNK